MMGYLTISIELKPELCKRFLGVLKIQEIETSASEKLVDILEEWVEEQEGLGYLYEDDGQKNNDDGAQPLSSDKVSIDDLCRAINELQIKIRKIEQSTSQTFAFSGANNTDYQKSENLKKKLKNVKVGDFVVLKDVRAGEVSAPAMLARAKMIYDTFYGTKSSIEIAGGLRFSIDNFKVTDDSFEFLERFGYLQIADVVDCGRIHIGD